MADNSTPSTTTQYIYPNYWEPLAQNASNFAAGLPNQIQGTYNNWYSGDLAAAPSGNTQAAYDLAANNPYAQQSQNLWQQGSTYDPNQLQQYLNPYTQDAAQATINASNRNFNQEIVPGLNSTFAGTGQFGSTRNADFLNRAIQNQQQTLTDSIGKLNYGAYQNAQQNYSDWANKQQQAATGLTNLGQTQMGNLAATGKTMEGLQQTAYDKTYDDWLKQQQYPTQMMGGLGTMMANMSQGIRPDVYTPTPQASDAAKVATALSVLSSGLDDNSIQSLLSSMGWNFGS